MYAIAWYNLNTACLLCSDLRDRLHLEKLFSELLPEARLLHSVTQPFSYVISTPYPALLTAFYPKGLQCCHCLTWCQSNRSAEWHWKYVLKGPNYFTKNELCERLREHAQIKINVFTISCTMWPEVVIGILLKYLWVFFTKRNSNLKKIMFFLFRTFQEILLNATWIFKNIIFKTFLVFFKNWGITDLQH